MYVPRCLRSGSFDNRQLAQAFEYSFDDVFGIVASVAFTVEAHNSSQIVQPQIAFNFVPDATKPLGGIPALFEDLPGSSLIRSASRRSPRGAARFERPAAANEPPPRSGHSRLQLGTPAPRDTDGRRT